MLLSSFLFIIGVFYLKVICILKLKKHLLTNRNKLILSNWFSKHDFEIITKLRGFIYSTKIQIETKGGAQNSLGSFLYTSWKRQMLLFYTNFYVQCSLLLFCCLFSIVFKRSSWNSNFKTNAEFNLSFTLTRVQSVSFEFKFG